MRYIEPHGHMVSRTTDDYQAMVIAGCQAVIASNDRKSLRAQIAVREILATAAKR